MQFQESTIISVNCTVCGQESFQVTLLRGKQRLKCTNIGYSNFTVVLVEKADNGDLEVTTWRALLVAYGC